MKKTFSMGLFGLLVIAGVIFLAWTFLVPAKIVVSDDGMAQLSIPPGALPKDVDVASISLVRIDVEADGHLASYTLLPDGLEFKRPVQVIMNLPLPEQPSDTLLNVPMPTVLLLGSDHSAEQVASAFELNDEGTEMRVTADIKHFSTITSISFTSARIDNVTDKQLNTRFFVGARFHQDRTEVSVPIVGDPNAAGYVFTMSGWYLWSGEFHSQTNTTSPDRIRDAPLSEQVAAGPDGSPAYAILRQFTCNQVGNARILHRVFSDGEIAAFLVTAQNQRTPVNLGEVDTSNNIRLTTNQFRCIAAETTQTSEIGSIGGQGEAIKTVLSTERGRWEVELIPSTLRAFVGEEFTVDAIVTDVTNELVETAPAAERAQLQTNFFAHGTWYADDTFDRTNVEIRPPQEQVYGGRITFRFPVHCISAGTGTIAFEAFLNRPLARGQATPNAPQYAQGSLHIPQIECVPPVSDDTEFIGLQVTPQLFEVTHVVGSTSCPQPMGSFIAQGPDGGAQTWAVSGAPAWLNIPSSGSLNEEIPISFNCGISRYDAHAEQATLLFTSGENQANVDVKVNVE